MVNVTINIVKIYPKAFSTFDIDNIYRQVAVTDFFKGKVRSSWFLSGDKHDNYNDANDNNNNNDKSNIDDDPIHKTVRMHFTTGAGIMRENNITIKQLVTMMILTGMLIIW